ncbi:thiamine pyrophosphate-dependent enzyme [Dehalogenimonas alkenigignens]|uniref:2-oxoacid:acceptor oxidoreductase, beta subunit, pyruvate/2-ketoisovalerate family n=1 Tax=Dehalogenimonas alkenigignens TaxID=1217799 RepID=A0A0W0GJS6_9CHLR|nr:thiamine pyrophosphate-dependent enzyme [Dehalogenimonas alkenigignens]KTB48822.1 2-oxoacid:acceptor oxidoreductase, beta subunit, pyruvate/2-ketoisovalerate family [Dehalogenimonas alkenigignens]PVV84771.1 2-oxoacid ferredoxin oxidoreductase [Dehalogenimonas alkenigignens]
MKTGPRVELDDYASASNSAWCPGCGNFGILRSLDKALVDLEMPPHQVLLVSGIGQAGKLPHYTRANVLNGLHGRPLPAATAAKLANRGLAVIAISGDGDGYGEGGNHFIHAMNRNSNLTYLVHNNQVYGLTKGQASPTTDLGFTTKLNPDGAWTALRPLALAVACDCSFVGRGFAGDIDHLAGLIAQAVKHEGFALIEILQPCISFNKKNTFQWYRERIYKVDQDGKYDPGNRAAAFEKASEWGDRIPIGVIYRHERPVFEDYVGISGHELLVKQPIDPSSVGQLFDDFT